MLGQALEVLAGLFAEDQQPFFDGLEVGVEGRGGNARRQGHVSGADFAQMPVVQKSA
ncbi:hypothetical protein D3C80_1993650 [compost metagenome]